MERALLMRGCPWKITPAQVQSFFDQKYGEILDEDIFIEEFNGKRTGTVLVLFDNKDTAQDAKAGLVKQPVPEDDSGRYVELIDCD